MSIIAAVDFEDGTLDGFDSTVTDGGDLSVEPGAALAGTNYGLQCVVDDTNQLYGQKAISWATDDIRFRFYFDPNGLTMGAGDSFMLLGLNDDGTGFRSKVQILESSGNYQITAEVQTDTGGSYTGAETITDAPHFIEGHIERATTDSASDGRFRLWVDGVLKFTKSNLDIFDVSRPDVVIMGAAFWLDAGTSGVLFLDQLVVRDDDTEIGVHIVDVTLFADPGSFAITGTDAGLNHHRKLAVALGAFAITGTAATLKHHRKLAVSPGTISITGTAASLNHHQVLSAGSGTISITGTDAGLNHHRVLAVGSGTFSITGTDATLTYEPDVTLSVAPGSFLITGTAATLTHHAPTAWTAEVLPPGRTLALVTSDGVFLVTSDGYPILTSDSAGIYTDETYPSTAWSGESLPSTSWTDE